VFVNKKRERVSTNPGYHVSAYHKAKNPCLMAGADAFLAKPFEMTTAFLFIAHIFFPHKIGVPIFFIQGDFFAE